jgi:hypothetical protein
METMKGMLRVESLRKALKRERTEIRVTYGSQKVGGCKE